MQQTFRVKKSEHGKTLQAFLHDKLATYSHKQIKNAIDRKCVFVNDKNVFISRWNLKEGDRVLFIADQRTSAFLQDQSRYHYVQVLYEDEDLLVTNKPPFIDYDSFVINVNAYLKRTHGKNFYPYVGQMHRLDKETSGVLIFTKKKRANILADQFRTRSIKKSYLALVSGRVERDHGVIRSKLEKRHLEGGRKVHVVEDSQEGKESFTEYWVEERYDRATCLRISLGTGRTHQIRVHMASIGHPIMGDKLYGDNSSFRIPHSAFIKRQALHAHRVEFHHPVTGKKIKITASLPKDMEETIDHLRMGTHQVQD